MQKQSPIKHQLSERSQRHLGDEHIFHEKIPPLDFNSIKVEDKQEHDTEHILDSNEENLFNKSSNSINVKDLITPKSSKRNNKDKHV